MPLQHSRPVGGRRTLHDVHFGDGFSLLLEPSEGLSEPAVLEEFVSGVPEKRDVTASKVDHDIRLGAA